MLRKPKFIFAFVFAAVLSLVALGVFVRPGFAQPEDINIKKVIVPEEDRFKQFARTIHVGQSIKWINHDGDDHTIVSVDFYNTAGNDGTDQLLLGTDNNGGVPGRFQLTFNQPGVFVYYCRFHATLDANNQPIAPGPDGGIAGTPMMGIVTVLP